MRCIAASSSVFNSLSPGSLESTFSFDHRAIRVSIFFDRLLLDSDPAGPLIDRDASTSPNP